jgi:hypothetical protein
MSRISSRAGARSTYVTGGGSASPEFRAARWNPRTCRNPASAQPSGPEPAAGAADSPIARSRSYSVERPMPRAAAVRRASHPFASHAASNPTRSVRSRGPDVSPASDLSLRAGRARSRPVAHRGARAPRRFPPGGLPGAWSEGRIDRIAAGAAVSAALRVPSRWRCTPVRDEL